MPAKDAAFHSTVLTSGLVGVQLLQPFLENRCKEPATMIIAGSFCFLRRKKYGTTEATAANVWSEYAFHCRTASIPALQWNLTQRSTCVSMQAAQHLWCETIT